MNPLVEQVEDYLRLRNALGYQLGGYRERLLSFVAYLHAAGATTVTVELAVGWAWQPEGITPITASFRLSTIRGFARYLHAINPAHEVPPRGVLAVPRRRPTPYLFSPEDLARILEAAGLLRPPLRAATYQTLFGLLAACGMRVGEALTLTGDDVNLAEGLLTIRHAKFGRMRLVPTHPSVIAALRDYFAARGRSCPTPRTDRFFVSASGGVLHRWDAERAFRTITEKLGLRTDTVHPRIHDLRHSMAVQTLIDWQREGADIPALLPVLSTYLGHIRPANTYWYLSATPELMQLAAARLEQHFGDRS
jgi:integrase/recombinase XerD